jgi:hypothetical protein
VLNLSGQRLAFLAVCGGLCEVATLEDQVAKVIEQDAQQRALTQAPGDLHRFLVIPLGLGGIALACPEDAEPAKEIALLIEILVRAGLLEGLLEEVTPLRHLPAIHQFGAITGRQATD